MTTELIAALRLIASLNEPTAAAVAREAVARFEKSPKGKITYVVQGRCTIGTAPGPWEEVPGSGKKNLYDAIAELERHVKTARDPKGTAPMKELGDLMAAVVDLYKDNGAHLELHIVKRTAVDEVIEETVRAI